MERLFGCDPAKRSLLLKERYFDLLDMAEIFEDSGRLEYIDNRYDYGEERRVTIGWARETYLHCRLHDARPADLAHYSVDGQSKGT